MPVHFYDIAAEFPDGTIRIIKVAGSTLSYAYHTALYELNAVLPRECDLIFSLRIATEEDKNKVEHPSAPKLLPRHIRFASSATK